MTVQGKRTITAHHQIIIVSLHYCIGVSEYRCTIVFRWIMVSLYHCITEFLYHCITVSLCHCITVSLHHGFIVLLSLYHCIIVSLYNWGVISRFLASLLWLTCWWTLIAVLWAHSQLVLWGMTFFAALSCRCDCDVTAAKYFLFMWVLCAHCQTHFWSYFWASLIWATLYFRFQCAHQ